MLAFELLRVGPLILSSIRSCVGPRLTERERSKRFLFLRPLADPSEFEHADLLSQLVLYFTVELVYAVIAPLTSFVLGFCFLIMFISYRHQFIFIYPKKPDSGGKLWVRFIRVSAGPTVGGFHVTNFVAELSLTQSARSLRKRRFYSQA